MLAQGLFRRKIGPEKEAALRIFGADGGSKAVQGLDRPGDVESGVVPDDGAFSLGMVKICGFVEDFGRFGQDKKTMSEAFGNPERLEFSSFGERPEMKASPFAEVGRAAAKIDGDVPNVARKHADQFSLRLAELIVQAAKNTFGRKGLVVLNELGRKSGLGKGGSVEDLSEPSAAVAKAFRLNQFDVEQRRIENLHPTSLPSKPW